LKNNYKKKQQRLPSQKKKRGKNLSPRVWFSPFFPPHREACHSISTALLQNVAEIGTQSTMESSKKT
jgi:hypothetical protein